MVTNVIEYNGNLFDQLSLAERLKRAHDNGTFDEEYELVIKEINRKLYQQPPLTEK